MRGTVFSCRNELFINCSSCADCRKRCPLSDLLSIPAGSLRSRVRGGGPDTSFHGPPVPACYREFVGKRGRQRVDSCPPGGKPVSCSAILVKNPKKGYEVELTLHLLCDISRTLAQSRGYADYVSR